MWVFSKLLASSKLAQFSYLLIVSISIAVGFNAVKPASAAAAECGVNTGSMHSLAGLVAELNWVPYGGAPIQATGSIYAHVWNSDTRGDSDWYQNLVLMDGSRSHPGSHYYTTLSTTAEELYFNQYWSGCGDGYNVVLGYGAGSTDTSYGASSWTLDCDEEQFGDGYGRLFTVQGYGVPDGARSGGWWSAPVIRANNGYTVYTSTTYYEPAPPNWTLSATTTASSSTVYAGQTVTFTNVIKNSNEGGTATFVYGGRYNYNGGGSTNYPTINNNGNLGPNATVTLTHALTIPANSTATQVCEWVAFDWASSWGARNGTSAAKCVTIIHPQMTCSASVGASSSMIEPGQVITLSPSMTFTNATEATNVAAASNFYVRVVNRSTAATIYNNAALPENISGAVVATTTGGVTPNTGSYYDVAWGVTGSLGSYDCTGTFIAAYHPYFIALGGDLVAGGSYLSGTTCTQNPSAVIRSWNNDSFPYFGAATELAAFALGDISHFATATDPATGNSTVGQANNLNSNLAFANTASPIGKFGAMQCMPDYYTTALATAINAPGTSLSSWSSGVYKKTGDYNISATTLPASGQNIVLIVDGSVYISGDIKYAAAPTAANIPRLTIIAKGNIYTDNNVQELHGAYIAQPTAVSGSGTFYSCAIVSGTSATVSSDFSQCNVRLNIYGAVSANKVNLGRSYGTLAAKSPAEIFQFTPELWLGGVKATAGNSTKYDAITSLPPTL